MTILTLHRPLLLAALGLLLATGAVAAEKKGDRPLPPGLEKKAARGMPLPPGWQKKLKVGEPLDEAVYRQATVVVPVDRRGFLTIRVEGKLIRLVEATREVVEILY